jgi:phosphatidylglycerophosphate synthase
MLDRRARPWKDRVLASVTARAAPHVPPVVLTVASVGVAAGAAAAAAAELWALAVGCWWVSRVLDGLDGPVARHRGEAGDLGGYLDMVGDTVGYALVPFGVAFGVDERATWIAVAALQGTLFVNAISWAYLAAVLEKRGVGARRTGETTSVTMPAALVEGTETVVLYTLFLALPGLAAWLFAAMAALVTVNVAQRLAWARAAIAPHPGPSTHAEVGR